jgi:predicted lactoylglutathione lyase
MAQCATISCILGITANLPVTDIEAIRSFYTDYLG